MDESGLMSAGIRPECRMCDYGDMWGAQRPLLRTEHLIKYSFYNQTELYPNYGWMSKHLMIDSDSSDLFFP